MPTFTPKPHYKSPKALRDPKTGTFDLDDLETNYNVWEIDPKEVPQHSDLDPIPSQEYATKIRRGYLEQFSQEHPELLYGNNENCFSFGSRRGLYGGRQTEIGCFCRVGSNYLIYTAMLGHGVTVSEVYRLNNRNKSYKLLFSESSNMEGNWAARKLAHIYPITALPVSPGVLNKSGTGLLIPYEVLAKDLRTPINFLKGSPYAGLSEFERQTMIKAVNEFYSMAYLTRHQLSTAILYPTEKNTIAADNAYLRFASQAQHLIPHAIKHKLDMTTVMQTLRARNQKLYHYLSEDCKLVLSLRQAYLKQAVGEQHIAYQQQAITYARFLTVLQLPFPNQLKEFLAKHRVKEDTINVEREALNNIIASIDSNKELRSQDFDNFHQLELLDIPLPWNNTSQSIIEYAITRAEEADKQQSQFAYGNVTALLARGAYPSSEFYTSFCSRIDKKIVDAGDKSSQAVYLTELKELVTSYRTKNLGKLFRQLTFLNQIQSDIEPLLKQNPNISAIREMNLILSTIQPATKLESFTSLSNAKKVEIDVAFERMKAIVRENNTFWLKVKSLFFNSSKTTSLLYSAIDKNAEVAATFRSKL